MAMLRLWVEAVVCDHLHNCLRPAEHAAVVDVDGRAMPNKLLLHCHIGSNEIDLIVLQTF